MSNTRQTGEAYFIQCESRCGNCKDKTLVLGPYASEDFALERAAQLRSERFVTTGCGRNGYYQLAVAPFERLPDGKLLVAGKLVCNQFVDRGSSPGVNEVLGHPASLPVTLSLLEGIVFH